MNKQKLYWICQISGWSLYGAANLIGFSYFGEVSSGLLAGEFFQVLIYLFSTHFLRLYIKRHDWFNLGWNRLIPRLVMATLTLGILNSTLNYFAVSAMSYRAPSNLAGLLVISIIVYGLWVLLYLMVHYFESYRQSLQHEAALNEIELNNLKSQLNPHFIFNALNSIRALVDEDPGRSKDAITQLSNILRNSLAVDKKRLIQFDDEMRTVKDYLALESIRYEERLRTSVKLHPDSEHFQVPPMMIQTLVENGIKHGVANLKNGGHIEIATDVLENEFIIRIRNSGQYLNGHTKLPGYGLDNTRKRLQLIYGEQASFQIANDDGHNVLTEIRLPRNERKIDRGNKLRKE